MGAAAEGTIGTAELDSNNRRRVGPWEDIEKMRRTPLGVPSWEGEATIVAFATAQSSMSPQDVFYAHTVQGRSTGHLCGAHKMLNVPPTSLTSRSSWEPRGSN